MHPTRRPLHQPLSVVFVIALATSLAASAFFLGGMVELLGIGAGTVNGGWSGLGFR